jgi:hypothetical protein
MADSLLICISAAQVSVAQWRGSRFAACTVFGNDENGLAAFATFLQDSKRMPVRIIVDAVEEDYRFESMPHSFGSDRSEMLGRKLRQHYRNTPYFSARPQGRDSGKRRDDRYLFCALTNPELIAGWLKAVQDRALPVVGIFLLPTVSAGLLDKLSLKQPNLLLVSLHSAGMRLTYFRDQKLRISRLARTDAKGPNAIKGYAEEISNTRLYLHALRVMTLDEHLSVLIIDRDDSLSELAQTIGRDSPNIDCRRVDRQQLAATLGMTATALESSNDALYLHLLGLRAPENNLAPAAVTASYRQHQLRRGLYLLTGLTTLTIASWCGANVYQLVDTRFDIDNAKRQTTELQAQYLEATRQFPAAPANADNLQRAVEISQKIGATTRSPEVMMDLVSEALEQHPAIYMRLFGWKFDRAEISSDSGANRSATTATPAPMAGAAPPPPGMESRKQSALVEGEVRPFRGDYRAAIESIKAFADTLSKRPEVAEVKVVKLPLDINPTLSLSGNTTENRDQIGKAEFKLVIVFKPSV